MAAQAERLVDDTDPLQSAASAALNGILTQHIANNMTVVTDEDRRRQNEMLHKAATIIFESRDRRVALGAGPLEIARSVFNISGAQIGLAKNQPDQAETCLRLAEQAYRDALTIRARFLTGSHPHVTCCFDGFAKVDYYRALLFPKLTVAEREQLFVDAAHNVHTALVGRQQHGGDNSNDALKSLQLTVKISLARFGLHHNEKDGTNAIGEYEQEAATWTLWHA